MDQAPDQTPDRTPIECRVAAGPEELAAHYAIRHQVFVVEQEIFAGTDRDAFDELGTTIHLVGVVRERPEQVVGAVRLYPVTEDGQVWVGDRLAVDHEVRVHQLGSDLVRLAVSTAARHGGLVMKAHIQLPNVTFFKRLGWTPDGPEETYHGRPHAPMAIDLTRRG